MSLLFTSGSQVIGASASASVLPMNIQGCFPGLIDFDQTRLTGLISLLSKELSRVFFTPQFKSINCLVLSLLYGPTLISIHDYWKDHSFDWMDLCQQMSLFFNSYLGCSWLFFQGASIL